MQWKTWESNNNNKRNDQLRTRRWGKGTWDCIAWAVPHACNATWRLNLYGRLLDISTSLCSIIWYKTAVNTFNIMYIFSSWCIISKYIARVRVTLESLIYSPLFFLFLLSDAFFYSFFFGNGWGWYSPALLCRKSLLIRSESPWQRQTKSSTTTLPLDGSPESEHFLFLLHFFFYFYWVESLSLSHSIAALVFPLFLHSFQLPFYIKRDQPTRDH